MTVTTGKTYPLAGPWQRAQSCTGRVAPGAAALLAWMVANRPDTERSMGIYNCRTVVGGSTTSLHGEGRALDWGVFPLQDGQGSDVGHELVDLLLTSADVLGIQCIIYDRTIWSARSPGGRRYTGVHPHYDHLHIELQWEQARTLSLNKLVEVLGGRAEKPPEVPEVPETPKPPPPVEPKPEPADWREEAIAAMQTVNLSQVRRGQRSTYVEGAHVRRLQALLAAAGHPPRNSFNNRGQPDGVGGPATREALGTFQRSARTGRPGSPGTADHVAGQATWTALVGV